MAPKKNNKKKMAPKAPPKKGAGNSKKKPINVDSGAGVRHYEVVDSLPASSSSSHSTQRGEDTQRVPHLERFPTQQQQRQSQQQQQQQQQQQSQASTLNADVSSLIPSSSLTQSRFGSAMRQANEAMSGIREDELLPSVSQLMDVIRELRQTNQVLMQQQENSAQLAQLNTQRITSLEQQVLRLQGQVDYLNARDVASINQGGVAPPNTARATTSGSHPRFHLSFTPQSLSPVTSMSTSTGRSSSRRSQTQVPTTAQAAPSSSAVAMPTRAPSMQQQQQQQQDNPNRYLSEREINQLLTRPDGRMWPTQLPSGRGGRRMMFLHPSSTRGDVEFWIEQCKKHDRSQEGERQEDEEEQERDIIPRRRTRQQTQVEEFIPLTQEEQEEEEEDDDSVIDVDEEETDYDETDDDQ
jgi:hypothetical protein